MWAGGVADIVLMVTKLKKSWNHRGQDKREGEIRGHGESNSVPVNTGLYLLSDLSGCPLSFNK